MPSRYAWDSQTGAGQQIQPSQTAPDNDATLRQDQPAGTAADASQPGVLRKAWDTWTSRPENNAAMINFGLQLMQPIGPGQSRLGHWGEAIGAGAEASSRNIGEQEARAETERKAELGEREEARKEAETGYYGEGVRSLAAQRAATGGVSGKEGMQARLRAQAAWQKWRVTPEDTTGLQRDPVVAYINKINPAKWGKYTTKAEIMTDPEARKAAQDYVLKSEIDEDRAFGTSGAGGGGFTPPPGAVVRYQGNRPVYFDPATKQPYPGQD